MKKKLFRISLIVILISSICLNAMEKKLDIKQGEDSSFIERYLKNPEIFAKGSIFFIPLEIGNMIAQRVLKSSKLLLWLINQIKFPNEKIIHPAIVMDVMFDKSGNRLVTACYDNVARIWDANTQKLIYILEGHKAQVVSAAFDASGTKVVTASWDCSAKIWDALSGKIIHSLMHPTHSSMIHCAMFNHHQSDKIVSGASPIVSIWNAITGELVSTLYGHNAPVHSAKFNHKNDQIVTASYDKTVRIWDANTGSTEHTLTDDSYGFQSVDFDPEDKRLVACCGHKAIIWDLTTIKPILKLSGHKHDIQHVEFNSGGTKILTASRDDTVKLWDSGTGELLKTFNGHLGPVSAAAFDSSANKIATASEDKTVRIWDISIINILERDSTLEQVLLLYYIYEMEIINRRNKLIASQSKKLFFDFRKYSLLRKVYDSLPEIVWVALNKYVILD